MSQATNDAPTSPLDAIQLGYCPACDQERRIIRSTADSLALYCGHTLALPPEAPIWLRGRADGIVAVYTDGADLLRVRRREGKAL